LAPMLAAVCPLAAQVPWQLSSPDGKTVLTLALGDFEGAKSCLTWSVSRLGRPVIIPSRLALDLEGGALGENLRLASQERTEADQTWKPVWGERSSVRDHYRQLRLVLQETTPAGRTVQYTFRAYDAGIAFCYSLPAQKGMTNAVINRELSEFRFAADYPAWAVYSAQGVYAKTPLSRIKAGGERPMTIEMAPDLYAALGEARLVDFARMKFDPLKGRTNALVSALGSKVELPLPCASPWRFVMAAESPGRLLENNDLLLNLNDPCAIADTSWIKPGKVIREVTLTTTGGKACVDFAVKRNLQYVEFDAGWYGHEYDDAADARAVNVDPKRSKGPLDLHEVIRYGRERGIGVILYVNRRALEKQLDEILPLYQKWGVKGVKYGFVNVGSQKWTAWLHDAIRKAARHGLMVDVHDEYRPTGFSRTYPNLMTAEGIAGDETSPANTTTLAILFNRMLAGPADNTICYYDGRVTRNSSHAYQLAKAVCLFSPWQFLYWYDRPAASPQKVGGAGGAETGIGDEPELAFFDRIPTVWDDTKVLHGKIGEYALLARRNGDEWFIGFMNSGQARALEVSLAFLPAGREYTASVYSDDPAIPTRTRVKIEHFKVTRQAVLKCSAAAQGGQAIHLAPAN